MSLDNPIDAQQLTLPGFDAAETAWREEYAAQTGGAGNPTNRSGIEVKPLYTPADWSDALYMRDLGFPGQDGMARGIYASMHRGRSWSQRQLIGLGIPEDYNARLKAMIAGGVDAGSLIPCNSVYRGYDADEVDPLLLGTCGVVANTVEDMAICYDGVPVGELSTALNDPSPFTLLALLIAAADQRGIPSERIVGTSNQSDYISHFVCNHMFFRLALPGARRVLVDHIAYCREKMPNWNPLSVVGQHMQQGGATPAEAMGLTLSTAIQYAEDCRAAGMDMNAVLPRFTFFFDISISFFEEIAKFRAARRIWRRITEERFGATNPKAWRFKFHGQTSGVDLTREQPLNNIARVTAQAIAGIFGGLQSLHTDAYDEVLSVPTEKAARIAIATQEILKHEARLTDVIDPLGGSYYVETLTDQMEAEIEAVIAKIDAAGGMFAAVEDGLVQRMIGDSAIAHQAKIDSGELPIIGVTRARIPDEQEEKREPLRPPPMARVEAQIARLKAYKADRDQTAARRGLDDLARAAEGRDENVYAAVVAAAGAGVTHGEICGKLRDVYGFGDPLIVP